MPSPLGHAMGGLAAGWLIAGRSASVVSVVSMTRTDLRDAVLFAVAGVVPDLDLLVGAHSGPTHGLGAAALTGLVAYLVTRRGLFSLALIGAYASHTLLDWLGSDSSPPIGIMALWPISRDYYESSMHVFRAISRRYWQPDFWTVNLRAIVREFLILFPLTIVIAYFRRRQ